MVISLHCIGGSIKLLTRTAITLLLSVSCCCFRSFYIFPKSVAAISLRTLASFSQLPSTHFNFFEFADVHFSELQKCAQFIIKGLNNDGYICKCYVDVIFPAWSLRWRRFPKQSKSKFCACLSDVKLFSLNIYVCISDFHNHPFCDYFVVSQNLCLRALACTWKSLVITAKTKLHPFRSSSTLWRHTCSSSKTHLAH